MDPRKLDEAVAAIVREIGVDAKEADRRKAYLKLEGRDLALLKEFHQHQPGTSVLVDAFYEHLLSFDETRALLSNAALMRLKEALTAYFRRVTSGDYDSEYVQNRIQIGLTHQRIGLEPKWYFGAYAQCLAELLPKVWQASGENAERCAVLYRAVLKVVFFDIGLAIDAYRYADQQAVSSAKDQLKSVLSSVPLGMLLLSEGLQILSANLAFREMQGDRDGEFRGKTLQEVLPVPGLSEWARLVIQQGGRQHQIMIDVKNFRGERRFQMVTMRGIQHAEGDQAQLLIIVEDITERQRAEQSVRDSRDLLLDFLENANELIQSVTPDGRFQFVNRVWSKTLGYHEEDLSGLTFFDIVHPDHRDHCRKVIGQVAKGESIRNVEMVFVTKQGRPITVEGNINSRMEEGKAVIIRAIFHDVTERKKAEEELRRTDQFLNSIIENIPNMIFVKEARELRFIRFNKAGEALLGHSRDNLIGKNDYDFFPKEQADFFVAKDREVFAEGKLIDIAEEPIQTRDKGTRILHTKKIPIHDQTGKPLYLLGISEDITERKLADERLKKSEAQLAAAQEIAHFGSWDWDIGTNHVNWSDELYRIYGLAPRAREITYEYYLGFIHPDDKARVMQQIENAYFDRQPFSYDHRIIRSDGSIRIIYTRGEVISDETSCPIKMIGTAQDITEQKQAEDELRKSEERFRQVAESISEVFWMTSADKNQMIYISPAYWEIWGRSPKKLYEDPRAWLDTVHPEDRERVIAAFPKQVSGDYDLEYRIIRPDGSMRWIRDRAFPIRNAAGEIYRVAGIAEDITERKQAEEALQKAYKELQDTQAHLLQSEKMASLGQMAAGVAHEINNPVGFVSSNLRTLEEYMSDLLQLVGGYESLLASVERGDSEGTEGEMKRVRALSKQVNVGFLMEDLSRLVAQSLDGMERVRRIVQDLKEFSHVDQAKRMRFNLNQGIESTLNIVWNELKYKAEVVKELGEIPEILCYPQQINQVFMNLLVNAAQAIKERGKIWIRSYVKGDRIAVEIEDTGCGIEPEHFKKIFDPFFTTKPVGKGTGLGLSVSYGIVQKHKGKIEVESTIGKGTKFRILLPISEPV